MIIKKINNKFYQIIIYQKYLDNINIYESNNATYFVKDIINNLEVIKGIAILDIFLDGNFGIIINIYYKEVLFKDDMDIKFNFKINGSFLYEIDYFYKEKLPKNSYIIYYYKNKFYLELVEVLDNKSYLNLLDNSNFYLDYDNIITINAIKL